MRDWTRKIADVFLRQYLSIFNQSVLQTLLMNLHGLRGRIHRLSTHPLARLVNLNGYHTSYVATG